MENRVNRNGNRKQNQRILGILLLCGILLLTGCGLLQRGEKDATVWTEGSMLRVGDSQIDYREGMVYLQAVQEEYESYYGSDIWMYAVDGRGNTLGELVKQQVLEQIIYIKVVCRQADALGIVLSDEELLDADRKTEEYMEKMKGTGMEMYGISEDIVRRIYQDNILARKTYEFSTLNVNTDISDEEAGQHVLQAIAIRRFKLDASGNRVSYSDEEMAELRARMQEIREQAQETDDFYKLAASITEDSSMLEITVGKGDLPEEYESRVLSLATGELSGVIETTDYEYVFYCVTEHDIDATLAKKEELIAARQKEAFQGFYEQWRQELTIEVNEPVWDSIGFDTGAVG